MKRLSFLAAIAAILFLASGFIPPHALGKSEKFFKKSKEIAIPNQYIVVLNEQVVGMDLSAPTVDSHAQYLTNIYGGSVRSEYASALKGFVANMTEQQALAMSQNENVLFVEQDGIIVVDSVQSSPQWSLDRVDQRNLPLDTAYNYTNAGTGVHAYIIDTGIYPTNVDFGGRASAVYDNVGDGQNGIDCNGHGTHVAGIIGAATWGVAKNVYLHGVRVVPCNGSGQISNLIDGINWVTANRQNPAVANISLAAAGSSPSLETSLTNSINSGVTYSVAAGNGGYDACNFTPARTPAALTVGATVQTDQRAAFSNYGTCVDLFAPGYLIVSTWIGSDTATNTLSGTSMAAPMVAGVAALYLEAHPSASSATVAQAILGSATNGALTTNDTTSPNVLLYSLVNGMPSATPTPTPTPTVTPTPTPSPSPTPNSVKVTVKKRSQGTTTQSGSTTEFPYSAVNLSTSSFMLQDNQDYTDSNVLPSTQDNPIVIAEAPVTGWQLMSIGCVDTAGGTVNASIDMTNQKVSIVAAASQQIECTFTSQELAPTAAGATVSGRVTNSYGMGVRGIQMVLYDPSTGTNRTVLTNSFGYYSFDNVIVGKTYLLTVPLSKWNKTADSAIITVNQDILGLNFKV